MFKNSFLSAWFPKGLYGIVFDCDGVMIDSEEANRFLYNCILEKLDLAPLTAEQEKFAFQSTFRDAIESIVPGHLHPRLDQAIENAINYDKDILPKIKLMPGYAKFVEMAHSEGLALAIDTNRTEAGIYKIIKYFDLPDVFHPVMCCSNTEPKPSPAGAIHIAKAWNISPEHVLFAGDSPDDGAAAMDSGMVFAAFGNPDLQCSFHIDSWPRLMDELWPEGRI